MAMFLHAPSPVQADAFRLAAPAMMARTVIPERFAFCRAGAAGRATSAPNISPEMRWSGAPSGTKSFALVMRDPDVPASAANVNVMGKSLRREEPRQIFYHWLLVDIPAAIQALPEGSDGRGITPHGKPFAGAPIGRRGINDYTMFLASDPEARGTYAGYDGPCPPWNDARLHHYRFTVYALDIAQLPLREGFTGRDLEQALTGHVLAQATLTRTFATARPRPTR